MTVSTALSAVVRAATRAQHQAAESESFVTALLQGDLPREAYADLLIEHRALYVALEDAVAALHDHPEVAAFADPRLTRVPSIEADLTYLLGDQWRGRQPTEATLAYVARVREVADSWPAGLVAHHYTRYLGDLSGGRVLQRAVVQHYSLPDHAGATFYLFATIDKPRAFKEQYRRNLDDAAWDQAERALFVDEVALAFDFNSRVFRALSTRWPTAGPGDLDAGEVSPA